MKNKFVYIMCFLLILTLFVSLTITYFVVEKNNQGVSNISNEYFDIVFSNPIIDFDTMMKVSVDDNNDKISVKIPDLNEFSMSNSFSIDVKNIGTLDAYVDRMFIDGLDSNINTSDVNIDISLVDDEIIKGAESSKLIITITYYGKNISTSEAPYMNFDLNYAFKEVIL